MRGSYLYIAAVLICTAIFAAPSFGKQIEEGVPRAQHPWGQFKVGAWKRVKTHTETLDESGRVASFSTTETTTKLVDVDDSGYTLRIDVVVEVAGKRFTAQPQVIRRGFNGEGEGQTVSVKRMGEGSLKLNGKKVACEVREITVDAGDTKRVTTVYWNERVAPYVLKRETHCFDKDGKPTDCNSQVDLVAVDMLNKVLSEMKSTSQFRIMSQQGSTSTLTLEVHCADIPGGVVSHTMKETDESGRTIRRSTMELLNYAPGTGEDADAQMVRKVYHRVRDRKAGR